LCRYTNYDNHIKFFLKNSVTNWIQLLPQKKTKQKEEEKALTICSYPINLPHKFGKNKKNTRHQLSFVFSKDGSK
jgi:hypothetical protein